MSGQRRAALIGAVAGLVFVLVNAGDLQAPWAVVARIVGAVAFVVVLTLLAAGGQPDEPAAPQVAPAAWRTYWVSVVLEVVALVVGARLLSATGHGELSLPWVVLVVGVHFVPFARAFRAPAFGWLGGVLVALGVVAALLALLGSPTWAVSLVSGVAAGAALLVFAGWHPVAGRLRAQR